MSARDDWRRAWERLQRICAEADLAREEAGRALLRVAEEDWGVREGSVVRSAEGAEYLVATVNPRPPLDPDSPYFQEQWPKPWVVGRPRRKDGEWSKAERHLFTDWDLP